jgi:hypothetical protein
VAHIAAADLPVDPFSALLTKNQPHGPYELAYSTTSTKP